MKIAFERVFRESFERILDFGAPQRGFFDAFYDHLLSSSHLIEKKFAGVDMDRQKRMLEESLFQLLSLFLTREVPDELFEVARKHDKDHADIPPHLYDLWLECLIDTIEEFDPDFDHTVELAWRMICSQGITLMTFLYECPPDKW